MDKILEKAEKIKELFMAKISSGDLQAGEITPMDLSELVIPGGIGSDVNMCYRAAKTLPMPVDPIMLDLDGDGLELKSASGSVLCDHDADGVRTATGWIGADDGILVRDLDGDGRITSGRELFGDEILKLNGQKVTNGFDALADLDSNHDGNFTSADAAWGQVKVWRDLDQDGVSDAGELFTLGPLGISRIGVTGSASDATSGRQAGMTINGNVVAQSASFTQIGNGVTNERSVGTVDLQSNAFYRALAVRHGLRLPLAVGLATPSIFRRISVDRGQGTLSKVPVLQMIF